MAEVRITIHAEDDSAKVFRAVEENSKDASGGVDKLGNACERAHGKAMDFIKGLAGWDLIKQAGRWVKDLAAGFLDAADTSEQYRTRLTILLRSQQEGNRLFDEMADYASKVPFEYEQIMGAATSLAGVMKGGVDEIKQWMPMIGDLAAASGLSIEETTQQVIRMYSAGAGAADLFRERGILAMMGFKAGASYSVEETRKKMMEEWQKADSQFKGATDNMANTWSGVISMIKDAWFKIKTTVMEAGAFDSLKEAAKDLKSWLDEAFATGKVKEWARTINTVVGTAIDVIKGLASAVAFVIRHIDDLTVALAAFALTRAPAVVSALIASFTSLGAAVGAAGTAFKGVLPVLAAVAGYELGKKVDEWVYKLTNIDLSGMNKYRDAQSWIAENQEFINKKLEASKARHAENKAAAEEAASASEEMIKKTIEGLEKLAGYYAAAGQSRLRFADAAFGEALKQEASDIAGMKTAMEEYLAVVNAVFSARIEGERRVADAMAGAGASAEATAKQQAQIFEVEQQAAQARLGAWEKYYSILVGMERKSIEDAAKQRAGFTDIVNSLRQKLMTEDQKYYDNLSILDKEYSAAMALEGEAKIKALTEYQQARAAMANEVKVGNEVIITAEQAVSSALTDVGKAQAEVEAERKRIDEQMATATAKAKEMIEHYQQAIIDLDNELLKQRVLMVDISEAMTSLAAVQKELAAAEVPRAVKIDSSQAVGAAAEVKRAIDAIPDVTYKKIVVQHIGTGSTEKPIMEKIAEIKDEYKDMGLYIQGRQMEIDSIEDGVVKKATIEYYGKGSTEKPIIEKMDEISKRYDDMVAGINDKKVNFDFTELTSAMSLQMEIARTQSRIVYNTMTEGGASPQVMADRAYVMALKGSYATGTEYVPEDGPYYLHKGEKVTPAGQSAGGNNYTFNLGGITIQGTDKSPEQLAREIARPLAMEFKRLEALR